MEFKIVYIKVYRRKTTRAIIQRYRTSFRFIGRKIKNRSITPIKGTDVL